MSKPFAITLDPRIESGEQDGNLAHRAAGICGPAAPVHHACPAGEDIQGWLYQAESGNYKAAWESLAVNNPFPAVMGRVCYHNCETACNRGQLDAAVNIHAVERFLGDEAIKQGWQFNAVTEPTGKRVLIVGAGPSGLSAAYHLARQGHTVVIHEAGPMPGGMMRFGIPKYRLPRNILDAEVARITAMGNGKSVEIKLNTRIDNLAATMHDGHFDAVFLATGAHIAKRAYIPAGDASRILDAVGLLRDVETGDAPQLGRRVIVYGGGNTALDAARTAKRLGAQEAIIVYRRTREKMPAHDFEVREALEEGIQIKWLSTIKQADNQTFVVEKMALDSTGFPQPTGEFETMEADSLVLALGQDVDLSFLEHVEGLVLDNGVLKVDGQMMTGHKGIFAGGDMVPSERTVTVAAGHGKKAARYIDAYLNGETFMPPAKHELAAFDRLNTWYYSDAPKTVQPMLDAIRRQTSFDEVQGGLDGDTALFEARRCLSCGNCCECDNCYGVCPDNAVKKLGPGNRFEFKYDSCKGCGLCVAECPCGAIQMVPETI
jgi:NADPH-dependent glutamate synthase beta subunit-like oxidoreductase